MISLYFCTAHNQIQESLLEYLEGKVLPGVAALDDVRRKMIAGNWKMHKTVG